MTDDISRIVLDDYKQTIGDCFEILQTMADELRISSRALGATAMEEVDMRRVKEVSFRIFVGSVTNKQISCIDEAVRQVEKKMTDAQDRFLIFEKYGEEAI